MNIGECSVCTSLIWKEVRAKSYFTLAQGTVSCLPQSCLECIARADCPGNSGSGWPTRASELLPAEHTPSPNKPFLTPEAWQQTWLSIRQWGWWIIGSFLSTVCHIWREKKGHTEEKRSEGGNIGRGTSARERRKDRKRWVSSEPSGAAAP